MWKVIEEKADKVLSDPSSDLSDPLTCVGCGEVIEGGQKRLLKYKKSVSSQAACSLLQWEGKPNVSSKKQRIYCALPPIPQDALEESGVPRRFDGNAEHHAGKDVRGAACDATTQGRCGERNWKRSGLSCVYFIMCCENARVCDVHIRLYAIRPLGSTSKGFDVHILL